MPATVLAIVDQSQRYGLDVLAGIDEVARREGWRVVIAGPDGPPAGPVPDGMVGFIDGEAIPPWLEGLRGRGVRLVRLDHDVAIDEAEVGACAARHLIERGLPRGASVGFAGVNRFTGPRCAGFHAVLPGPAFGLRLVEWDEQMRSFGPWLRGLDGPVGIFAANDHVGRIVLRACAELGLAVPARIAVVAADNDLGLCLGSVQPLSSVRMPHLAQGVAGAERLLRLLRGEVPGPPATVRPGSVCGRGSSDVLHCADPEVSRALAWIRTHFASPTGVDAVAAAVGVNRRTLERRFRAVLGRSLHDELRRARVARAQELLCRESSLPLAAVAAAVGMSPSSFASAFAAETGRSPGAWRAGRSG